MTPQEKIYDILTSSPVLLNTFSTGGIETESQVTYSITDGNGNTLYLFYSKQDGESTLPIDQAEYQTPPTVSVLCNKFETLIEDLEPLEAGAGEYIFKKKLSTESYVTMTLARASEEQEVADAVYGIVKL